MAVSASITVNDSGVKDILDLIEKRLGDTKPAFGIIGEIVQASVLRNFETGGRPKWAGLSTVTKKIRKTKGKWPGQVLRQSGAMSRIVYQASSSQVAIQSNEKYAATQHFGAKKGSFGRVTVVQKVKAHVRKLKSGKSSNVKAHKRTRRNVPVPWGDITAREFMVVQDEDWTEIKAAVNDYLFGS